MHKGIWIVLCTALLYACSGGGSGGTTTTSGDSTDNDNADNTDTSTDTSADLQGLTMPETMSIVTAKSEDKRQTASVGDSGATKRQISAYDDAGTDFSTDPINTYVFDSSMVALDTVNMILCLMSQTGASAMVNQGPYIAMVNEDDCEQGENQSSTGETGQSSGGQTEQLNTWTVNSKRADENSAQVVNIWVPGQEPEPDCPDCAMDAQNILIELTVNEGISATDPFGDFSMNFKGVVDAAVLGGEAGTETETMRGTLATVDNNSEQPQFRYVNVGGDAATGGDMGFSFEEAVNVILDDADGTSGKAVTRVNETYEDEMEGQISETHKFALAFDQSNLLRGRDTDDDELLDEQQCLSRDQFTTRAWRYNLYHRDDGTFNGESVAEGQRVSLSSGFPFSYDSNGDGGNDAYGWAGYHGVWADTGALADGDTINRFQPGTDATSELTVNISAGKMIRRSASEEPVSGFVGDEFQYFGEHPTLIFNGYPVYGEWIVTVNASDEFVVTHSFEWGDEGPVRSDTVDHDNDPNTGEVSAAGAFTFNDGEWLSMWSDALGGDVVYVHNSAATTPVVTFYDEEFVSTADSLFDSGAVTLYCYERCLKGGLTQTDIDNDMDLFYNYAGTAHQYTLSAGDGKLVLTDVANDKAVDASALDMSKIGNDWGINTGEMLTARLNDESKPWLAFEADLSFRWETGPNEWNRLTTVTDIAGDVQSFDPPLRFAYTHSTANDANDDGSYDGKKFMLEYNGPGDLWGFPWVEEGDSRRWYPTVTLADGVQLSNGDNTFVVKATEKEQIMETLGDETQCPTLDITGTLSDPDLQLPASSDIGTVSISLADKPSVTDPPAVIKGELQD